jgi:hypothetical protein
MGTQRIRRDFRRTVGMVSLLAERGSREYQAQKTGVLGLIFMPEAHHPDFESAVSAIWGVEYVTPKA